MSPNVSDQLPIVLAITGASGSVYGLRILQYFLSVGQPVDLCVSKGALQVMAEEMHLSFSSDLKQGLLDYLKAPTDSGLNLHKLDNYGASIASGSYRTKGMAIVPCSLGTLGAIASGLTDSLIHRAAAVSLKERRPLMLLLREMPFGQIQLKHMLTISEAGGIVAAASPGFYHQPETVSDMVDFVVGRVLDQFAFDHGLFKRWKEENRPLALPSRKPKS